MENSFTRWVYNHSPVFMQNIYTTIYGLRKRVQRYSSRQYKEFYDLFSKSRSWSFAELRAYQDERLRDVIEMAYEHVPFYRRRFDELKLRPSDIRTVDDLPKLPMLTKQDIRTAGNDMVADNYPRSRAIISSTSGSTGFPLTIWWSQTICAAGYAYTWACTRPLVRRGERYASFTGLELIPADTMKPPFWRVNYASNQRCYSVFHMTEETMALYIDDLQRHPCAWFEGYATAIYVLARYVLDHGILFTANPKVVFTTSEQLQPGYREAIEQAFGTRVFDQYGQHERSSNITEYPCGHMHDDMAYAITEFIPQQEQDDGTVAEIVGTTLYNEAMPLIRYRIGDLALLPHDPPQCDEHAGRIVSAIYGRTNNIIVTKDGRRISNISVIVKRCNHVNYVQVVQEQIGAARICVVRDRGYTERDEQELLHQFRLKMGNELDLEIEYLDEPIKTQSGKTLSIISRLKHG